ncbi:hypothetical protein BU23DRAFT_628209 [Bimuria novae-zelandiae CBS 107.79]|uniref:Uncharacterized protein n=1 Tax=Bimuria novae-zelandiae CBS 107.79 TaxID=1447943 RepID=A0A6A5VJG8_9PLEO|nr:hypothetical protein BU23DRAFT_628209 [Bimuria novae-zelandiae CBS 107.79]
MLNTTHDHNGQLHAGTIGLFDDPDEIDAAKARVQGRAALAEAKEKKKQEKEQKKGEVKKLQNYEGTSFLQRVGGWFELRGEGKGGVVEGLILNEVEVDGVDGKKKEGKPEGFGNEKEGKGFGKMYDWSEVDTELDSPFYEELGLVRIKAGNGRDVKVVFKSQIRCGLVLRHIQPFNSPLPHNLLPSFLGLNDTRTETPRVVSHRSTTSAILQRKSSALYASLTAAETDLSALKSKINSALSAYEQHYTFLRRVARSSAHSNVPLQRNEEFLTRRDEELAEAFENMELAIQVARLKARAQREEVAKLVKENERLKSLMEGGRLDGREDTSRRAYESCLAQRLITMKLMFWTLLAFLAVGCFSFQDRSSFAEHHDDATDNPNLTRRWFGPPPGLPSDDLWNTAKYKGRNLYNAFWLTDQEVGQIFNPPRQVASNTWQRRDLNIWGWNLNKKIGSRARNLGAEGLGQSNYGIARALRSLRMSDRDVQDGGSITMCDVFHFDPESMMQNPPVPVDDQKYVVNGAPRRYTGSVSTWGFSVVDGVIINTNIKSAVRAALEREPPVPGNQLPELRALSDIQWVVWGDEAVQDPVLGPQGLKWYFFASVVNEDTLRLIRGALENAGGIMGPEWPLEPWPGLWIPIIMDAGLHKPLLGNMWVDGVVVFEGDTLHRSPCLAFHLRRQHFGVTRHLLPGDPDPQNFNLPYDPPHDAIPDPRGAGPGRVFPRGVNVSEILRQRTEEKSDDDGAWILD